MAGPALFAAVLLALTALQYNFLLGIGWRPLRDPAGAWSSGLALGPYGWAQTASFVVSGLLLMLFAAGLHLGATDGRGSRFGPALLFTAGAAIALMGSRRTRYGAPPPERRTASSTIWPSRSSFSACFSPSSSCGEG